MDHQLVVMKAELMAEKMVVYWVCWRAEMMVETKAE